MSMFGHSSQHGHMMAGVAKAAASPKTPAHLKAHLEKRMAKTPNTVGKSQNKPGFVMKPKNSPLAEHQIQSPPEPFRNPMGAANVKVAKKKSGGSFFGGR